MNKKLLIPLISLCGLLGIVLVLDSQWQKHVNTAETSATSIEIHKLLGYYSPYTYGTTTCDAFAAPSGDVNFILNNGYMLHRNGYVTFSINLNDLSVDQQRILLNSSSTDIGYVYLSVEDAGKNMADYKGNFCDSFVKMVSVVPMVPSMFNNLSTTSTSGGSVATTSDNFDCPTGLTPIVIMGLDGSRTAKCAQEPATNPLDYLIGTGTQAYTLTGYYMDYKSEYYPGDYDYTNGNEFPKIETCRGFVITAGDKDFIDVYNQKIKQLDGKTVINLDHVVQPVLTPNGPEVVLPQLITSSTKINPVTIKVGVYPLPEGDIKPCESWGIHLIQ